MIYWTFEEKTEVSRLAAFGLSASQIATSMNNGKSRNAVISLCNRLGYQLQGSHGGGRTKGMRMPRKKKAAPVAGFLLKESSQPVMRCQPLPPEVDIPTDPIKFEELKSDSCRYPFGGGNLATDGCRRVFGDSDYTFCGRTKIEGLSWCASHCRIVYQRPQPGR